MNSSKMSPLNIMCLGSASTTRIHTSIICVGLPVANNCSETPTVVKPALDYPLHVGLPIAQLHLAFLHWITHRTFWRPETLTASPLEDRRLLRCPTCRILLDFGVILRSFRNQSLGYGNYSSRNRWRTVEVRYHFDALTSWNKFMHRIIRCT